MSEKNYPEDGYNDLLSALASKPNKPQWLNTFVRTLQSRDVTLETWNSLINVISNIASDTVSISDFLQILYKNCVWSVKGSASLEEKIGNVVLELSDFGINIDVSKINKAVFSEGSTIYNTNGYLIKLTNVNLAANSVTTEAIASGAVTLSKFDSDVLDRLSQIDTKLDKRTEKENVVYTHLKDGRDVPTPFTDWYAGPSIMFRDSAGKSQVGTASDTDDGHTIVNKEYLAKVADTKLDSKANESTFSCVYAVNSHGNNTEIPYAALETAETVMLRDENGRSKIADPDPNSATDIANVKFVKEQVAGIVNSAPETLDTLQELSKALGDDPNFANTVITELGTKSNATNITNGTALNSLVGNAIENNQVISENVSSFGTNNFTGLKGYYWSDIDFNAKKIQISKSHTDTTEITCKYQVGDVISIVNKFRYENCSTITAVDINTVTVDSLPFSSIENTTADYSDYVIYCPEKPDIGEVDLGKNAIAFGEENSASNRSVLVAGRQNKASGQYSASLGRLNKSLGYGSVTMGRQCVASEDYSMAVGYKSKAISRFSNAEGYGCVAGGTVSDISQNPNRDKFTTGFYSHAEGYATLSSGLASHSEGLQTAAAGSYSHIEGFSSNVAPNEINTNNYTIIKESWYNKPFSLSLRDGGHAEGRDTLALAKYSHAQNESCIAQNIGSHAGGNHTVTSRAYQTAIGEYNADNTSALLIVGNGSDTKRSNALELDKNGNTKIAGSLTLDMNGIPKQIDGISDFIGTSSTIAMSQKGATDYTDKTHYGYSGDDLLIIPEGTTTINDYAYKKTNYKCVVIPNSVTRIGFSAFEGCTGLTNITIPDSVTIIGDYAFASCPALKSVTIPDSVTRINWGAFSGCSRLTSVTIGNGVTRIVNYAFASCPALKSITIPNSVEKIEYGAFQGSQITIIDLTAFTTESFPTIDANVFELGIGDVIKVVKGRKNELANLSTNWSAYADYIVEVPTVETVDAELTTLQTELETGLANIQTATENIIAIQTALIGG